MKVQVVDNFSRKLASVLVPLIDRSEDVRIAVAFMSRGGLTRVVPAIESALRRRAFVEFLVGLDLRATEPGALRDLYELACTNTNLSLCCYASFRPTAIYHPKMYLLRTGGVATAIVGSSNLTAGGLEENVEVNVVMEASVRDEIISDMYGTYTRLKFHLPRVIPDEEYLALYAQLCEREKETERVSKRDAGSRALLRAFTEKAKSLRRPAPTKRDLVGWLELVYDTLPDGEFTNRQVYVHESEFQEIYPQNLNIRAKVRQQLQVLRDMGFVEHVGTARWRKV